MAKVRFGRWPRVYIHPRGNGPKRRFSAVAPSFEGGFILADQAIQKLFHDIFEHGTPPQTARRLESLQSPQRLQARLKKIATDALGQPTRPLAACARALKR